MKTPETLEILVTDIAHDGRGIGRSSSGAGPAVFVAGALPGDVVACRVLASRKNRQEAELVHILSPGRGRLDPFCPHWRDCGGCPLQCMPYEAQTRHKEEMLRQTMTRIGKLAPEQFHDAWLGLVPALQTRAYRRKMEFAFGQEGEKITLGFRARYSHAVVDLRGCAVIPPAALEIVSAARELANDLGMRAGERNGGLRSLVLRASRESGGKPLRWLGILLASRANRRERKRIQDFCCALLERLQVLDTIVYETRSGKNSLSIGGHRVFAMRQPGILDDSAAVMSQELGGRVFSFDAASFFQVNEEGAENIARMASGMDRHCGGTLLDLYCGAGAPGQLLSPRHPQCIGVEADAAAARFASSNAARAGLDNWTYVAGDAGGMTASLAGRGEFNTALLDPPRSGADARLLEFLKRVSPRHILYISCNPATFARDARVLAPCYELLRLGAVDMFPHTPHLECCGLWQRR